MAAERNISIYSYNLERSKIDNLPPADKIRQLNNNELDDLLKTHCSNISTIYSAPKSSELNWETVHELRKVSKEFEDIFKWAVRCVQDQKPYDLDEFKEIQKVEYLQQNLHLTKDYCH